MVEAGEKTCRICLTTNNDDNISDASRYSKFFSRFIMSPKDLKEMLYLCIWCKAYLRRAMIVLTLALKSEKSLRDKVQTKPKKNYTLNYTHNSHIDIPPYTANDGEIDITNTTTDIKIENVLQSQNEDEIIIFDSSKPNEIELIDNSNKEHYQYLTIEPQTRKYSKLEQTKNIISKLKQTQKQNNLEQNQNSKSEQSTFYEGEIKKRDKKEWDCKELKFEIEYLNLEEQLKEVEMKRLKYSDFTFVCNECGLGFVTADVYKEHRLRHSEAVGSHKCHICSLYFKSAEVLSQHLLAHKRRFKCVLCHMVYKRWPHCVAHRHKCGGIVTPVKCRDCGKVFTNIHSLKVHTNIHRTDATATKTCEQCNKTFFTRQKLTIHMRSHTGIKPYSCPVCKKCFSTSSNLRAHSATHIQTNEHYCVECHTYYKTAKSLKRHFNESVKHRTTNSDKYPCKECSKQFPSEKSLNNHFNTQHIIEHRCKQCDKTFSNHSNLNKHMKCIHGVT